MIRTITIILFISVSFVLKCKAENCTSNPTGTYYNVYSTADSGPGSLRQAILDANTDQTGGQISISTAQPITLTSPLPTITADSLVLYGLNIDFNNSISEPLFTFSNSNLCVSSAAYFFNVIPATFIVTNTNDTGAGSLREALMMSNSSASSDQIHFNIPGAAPHTISTLSSLPEIFNGVSIIGSTQPSNGYSGTAPKIALDGSLAPSGVNGFTFIRQTYMLAQIVSINGLFIHDYSVGISVSHMIPTIGGFGSRNIINNCGGGLHIEKSNGVTISNNYFGVDSSGLIAYPNAQAIVLVQDSNTTISNNLISGNNDGMRIASGINHNVSGNKVGTDASGMIAVPNTVRGLSVSSGTPGVTISGNLISGNRNATGTCHGIELDLSMSIQITGNKIGTNITGNDTLGNDYGIFGFCQYDVNNNLISGNTVGIYFHSTGTITNNKIGTDITGASALPNQTGIRFELSPTDSLEISGNLISGNNLGINALFPGGYCVIKKNYIGLDNTHLHALPNSTGISYSNASQGRVMIGGVNPSDGNYVCGNTYCGIGLGCLCTPVSTIVRNNKIGVNVSNGAVGNHVGISISSTGNIVTDNIVKNNFVGIQSFSNDNYAVVTANTIENNTTGIIADGMHASIADNVISNNDQNGIKVTGDYNTISENSIFDNGLKGIELDSFNTGNNYINPPVILAADADSISGTGLPNAIIELFYNHSVSQYQQGKTFISSVIANNSGNWKYVAPLNQPCNVTATQTDSAGNTSEFANMIISAFAGPDSIICTGTPLTMYATSPPIGQYGVWSSPVSLLFADSSQANTLTTGFNSPGFYTLIWSVTNFFCTNTDSIRIDAQICTGLNTVASENIRVYPNPTTGKFYIDVPRQFINSGFCLFDVSGKKIFTGRIENSISVIDIPKLSEGLYFFRLTNDSGNFTGKILLR